MLRVKDIYPYIINRRVEVPEKSYHEVADCKVPYIYATISGIKVEVE